MKSVRALAVLLVSTLIPLVLSSCAKYPENRTGGGGKRLFVTLRVQRQIQTFDVQPPYSYFVLLNQTENINDAGPVPVIGSPWGNGFAAASQPGAQGFTAFVQYDRNQPQGGYGVYRVVGPPFNAIFTLLGAPDQFTVPQAGEATLSFQLDLNRLKTDAAAATPRYLQINFLATNNIPRGDDPNSPKSWDALGNGSVSGEINSWITIDTTQDGVYSNADRTIEPPGDVREKLLGTVNDPDLDIVDWTVRIQSQ